MRIDDPWPRLNLCTAIQRLLMFGAITTLDTRVAAALAGLLRGSLAGIPALRATAAAVVSDLFTVGMPYCPPQRERSCAMRCSRWSTTR